MKKDNCWLEQSPENSTVSTVPFFVGHPVFLRLRATHAHPQPYTYFFPCFSPQIFWQNHSECISLKSITYTLIWVFVFPTCICFAIEFLLWKENRSPETLHLKTYKIKPFYLSEVSWNSISTKHTSTLIGPDNSRINIFLDLLNYCD